MSLEINFQRLHRKMKYQPPAVVEQAEPIDYPLTGGAEELIYFPSEAVIVDFRRPNPATTLPLPPKTFYYPNLREMAAD